MVISHWSLVIGHWSLVSQCGLLTLGEASAFPSLREAAPTERGASRREGGFPHEQLVGVSAALARHERHQKGH
ncbi:MAG: hypothetical protein V7L23_02410 [Nostoc sp.]|uniref:hypothetical protein n=1 Tax=Nostoc sp. TaxID=1180 RepID=UPI002FEEBBF6